MTDQHRKPIYQWVVMSDSQDEDEDEYGTHFVCKGDGFRYYIVGTTSNYQEAEEMAIAMNYWETRPAPPDEGAL